MLTHSLALKHAQENIRVNCVCPGTINGPMAQAMFASIEDAAARAARMERMLAGIPMRRFGEPRGIAAAVLYLLSDDAAFTTGIALPVDGGRLA